MASRALPKSEWKAYFDHLSKNLIGERAELKIAGLASGNHIEARWVPLLGSRMNPKATFWRLHWNALIISSTGHATSSSPKIQKGSRAWRSLIPRVASRL